jgi:integrase
VSKRPLSTSKKKRQTLSRISSKRVPTAEEFERLHTWARATLADSSAAPEVRMLAAIVLVLIGTAARRRELAAFVCGDFHHDPTAGLIAHFEAGKGNKEAEVPITEETYEAVRQWLVVKRALGERTGAGDPLFCGRPHEFMSMMTLHKRWKAALRLAGVPQKYGVHAARHAAGMMYLRATQSLVSTAEFMRHASEEVTRRFYKHVLPSDIRAGLRKAGL